MKFTCTQENFARGLNIVTRAASKNIALPILNNVLIVADGGQVRLQTTNLEVAVTTTVRAKVDQPGRYTVGSRLLHDYVNLIKNSKIEVSLVDEGVMLNSEHSETVIKGLPADEFPVLPMVSQKSGTTVPANVFRQALQEVIFAAANDESRPEISGVYMRLSGDQLVMAATDSYRLAERKITTLQKSEQELSAIVPARACQEIMRICGDEVDSVKIQLDEQQALFVFDDTELVTRLIEGQYPDYRHLIPEKYDTITTVAASELIDAIKAASLFCQPGINDLAMKINPGQGIINLSAASTQAGRHASSVTAKIDGPEKDIVFNFRYLLEGVQSLNGSEVVIQLGEPQAPGILRSESQAEALYLLMPIRQ
jgi:DNA polymerase-3 subunit beta